MASEPQVLYLEPDDEITSVVRRLRQTDASRIVLVAPARTKATSSAVALRLLAAVAADEGRSLALVADPLARTLAGEAGIAAFASLAHATAAGAGDAPVVSAPAQRAAIHVVRPDETGVRPTAAGGIDPAHAFDETRAVPVARPVPPRRAARPRARRATPRPGSGRRGSLIVLGALIVALLLAGTAGAAVLPAATVHISPATRPVGPVEYQIAIAEPRREAGELPLTMTGRATGEHVEHLAASGTVTFENWNYRSVAVAKGTRVAAGDVIFATTQEISVPAGTLTGRGTIQAGQGNAPIVAVEPGPAGNVAAGAVNRIEDRRTANDLRGFPSKLPLVHNDAPTTGGAENHAPQIQQADVDALRQQIADGLRQQLAARLAEASANSVLGPAGGDEQPTINVPDDLVGKVGAETFELSGTLAYQRLAVPRDELIALARQKLLDDPALTPPGASILPDSIQVVIGEASGDGKGLQVAVSVTAAAAPNLDPAAIRRRIANLTASEAQAALAEIGPASVTLWPAWVGRVPALDWRVSVEADALPPQASGSPGA
jgi:hypothetical protein